MLSLLPDKLKNFQHEAFIVSTMIVDDQRKTPLNTRSSYQHTVFIIKRKVVVYKREVVVYKRETTINYGHLFV